MFPHLVMLHTYLAQSHDFISAFPIAYSYYTHASMHRFDQSLVYKQNYYFNGTLLSYV